MTDFGFKIMANEEHRNAEMQRLRRGYDGCGCSVCQELYRTADISIFGDRVNTYQHLIFIVGGTTGADLRTNAERRAATGNNTIDTDKIAVTKQSARKVKGKEDVTDSSPAIVNGDVRQRHCVVCGAELPIGRSDMKYCSSGCRVKRYRQNGSHNV